MKQKFSSRAEKQRAYRERQATLRLANTVTKRGGTVTESVTVGSNVTESTVTPVTVEWDRGKYPERKAWEIAVVRVERARKYAEMFPAMIRVGDEKYQSLEWQYENEGLAAARKLL